MRGRGGSLGVATVALSLYGLVAAAAGGIAGAASGEATAPAGAPPELTIEGSLAPRPLAPHRQTPIGLDLRGRVESSPAQEAHPAAIRTLQIDFPDLEIHTRGIPACHPGIQVAAAAGTIAEECRLARIGAGTAVAQVQFAEEEPVDVNARLLAYNGGTRGGKTTLFVRADFSDPISGTTFVNVTVTHLSGAGSGARVIAEVPQLAGGSGSITSFQLRIDKEVGGHNPLSAACDDGEVRADVAGGFEDGTEATTEVALLCGPA